MGMTKLIPATRTEHMKYAIRDSVVLAEKARAEGREMFYLNIGDPILFDFDTPEHIIDAIHKAQRDGFNGYAPSSGVDEALDSIRRDAERRGITNIQDIFVTSGVSEGIEIALSGLLNHGDNILTPLPGYPLYTTVLSKLEAEPNEYVLDEKKGWQPDLNDIESRINDRTRGIVIIDPDNPTGGVYSRDVLEGIIDLARRYNLVVFTDEIYDRLILDDKKHTSIASLAPDIPVLTMNGLSKAYLMPGLRIGWTVVSGDKDMLGGYIEAMQKMIRARLCACHPAQFGIPAALDGDQSHIRSMINKLRERRDLCYEMINAIPGLSMQKPEGAFYAFPRLDGIPDSDAEFVKKLLLQTGVVTVPGSGFGQKPGSSHFRIVFLAPEKTLERACGMIADFVSRNY